MSNLRLINETSGSSVTNISITDVFNSDFDIYKFTVTSVGLSGSGTTSLNVRAINSSGSLVSASNYDYARLMLKADTTFAEDRATNQDKIYTAGELNSTAGGLGATFFVINPYSSSRYTFFIFESQGMSGASARGGKGIAVLKQSASMGGIKLYSDHSTTMTSITARCYGLRVDS